ncbi:methylated-DNA--[protein]-cysteine S-methyltransferase [Kribbella sandramycini]|uniref:methylated-DNA--[protein]-cysteine S-methyltransferase n=1 Tax=Kribbella sandramycini TaxID=60450 RepID=A0A7Y4P0K9_9ACTN|nr:methylated-DNA--[protein]-cysteine S-methyltransferase [Kribbella sandramycini]MBB6565726.1 methylated-DNA-[protein]-cysteine S-methyltransferase [Kribbella sandramycini]NOL41988.1 methylated-DNA--[protein]-cysteine S-methyltransferase [Kribbella sandramycini]
MNDLEARLARFAATDPKPPTFPDADVAYTLHDTAIGTLLLAVAHGRVVASSFADEETMTTRLARAISPRVLRQPRPLDDVRRQLDEYLAGARTEFTVDVDLTLATPFQQLVLTDLRTHTAYGATKTYGELAGALDRPKAARAVGTALGANPVCVVLPCHRVIGASGALTGYAGGLQAKQFLLNLEKKTAVFPPS